MQKIYKYEVPLADEIDISMPQGAQLLTVQTQRAIPCIWALVDPDRPLTPRKLAWRGTGHPADGLVQGMHVGTIQLEGGALVFHLFDRGER